MNVEKKGKLIFTLICFSIVFVSALSFIDRYVKLEKCRIELKECREESI